MTALGMTVAPAHLVWLIIAATLCLEALGDYWYEEAREMRPADSVRVRAVPAMSTLEWSSGGISDPAGLRSVEYQFQTKRPYEWFMKFNLDSYKDSYIKSASLVVSKCAASSECLSHCKGQGKCSCATIFNIADPSCGGGNIDEQYDAGSDDLHVWHVSNNWDNHMTYSDWKASFDGTSLSGVQSTQYGSGGDKKLTRNTYISGIEKVGKEGTASLDVFSALGLIDPAVSDAGNKRLKVRGGYESFRLTVNGTNSRFFVPEGGDVNFIPRLQLHVVWTTTTTTTSTTSTTTSCPSCTTTTLSEGPTTSGTTNSASTTAVAVTALLGLSSG